MVKFTSMDDLTSEQQERASHIQTKDELLAFLKDEEIELTDAQLAAISGGDTYTDAVNDVGVG